MKFVFWQNFLSIHQSAFLRNLAEKHEVVLVVSEKVGDDRIKQGWRIPDFGKVEIVEISSDKDLEPLLNNHLSSWHIFSGFNLTRTISKALNLAVSKKLQIGVMSEPYRWTGIKGKIRLLKLVFYKFHYSGKIKFMLLTGTKAIQWFRKAGFDKEKTFHWGYFTEATPNNNLIEYKYSQNSKPDLLFIGQLNDRKNIIELILSIKKYSGYFNKFRIIGDGPSRQKVMEMIESHENIEYMGSLNNNKVIEILQKSDLLVLPSKFDGWGAVVNESIQAGTPVIVSENCGASDLLDGDKRGEIFYFSGNNTLEVVLKKWIQKGKVSLGTRSEMIEWSKKNISGGCTADYFLEIVDYVSGKTEARPIAPWLNINN